jgi:hypothetical protein
MQWRLIKHGPKISILCCDPFTGVINASRSCCLRLGAPGRCGPIVRRRHLPSLNQRVFSTDAPDHLQVLLGRYLTKEEEEGWKRQRRKKYESDQRKQTAQKMESARKDAQQFLDQQLYPVGSFNESHIRESKRILDLFLQHKAIDFADIAIELFERLITEVGTATKGRCPTPTWLCDPLFFNPILTLWRDARKSRQLKVMTPKELFQKIQKMHSIYPKFRYTRVSLSILTAGTIVDSDPKTAPFIIQEVCDFMMNQVHQKKQFYLRPNAHFYSQCK